MKPKQEMETTDNSNVFRKAEKRFRSENGEIPCSRCKYHRNENRIKKKAKFKKKKSWRDYKGKPKNED